MPASLTGPRRGFPNHAWDANIGSTAGDRLPALLLPPLQPPSTPGRITGSGLPTTAPPPSRTPPLTTRTAAVRGNRQPGLDGSSYLLSGSCRHGSECRSLLSLDPVCCQSSRPFFWGSRFIRLPQRARRARGCALGVLDAPDDWPCLLHSVPQTCGWRSGTTWPDGSRPT